ncbi:hypothetical protein Acsp04_26690 [Actinomadura sp. NBRC 104425]|nr:hypothetical protein Acsp04_26690 [Actinomadura sp. NBRC 104425]
MPHTARVCAPLPSAPSHDLVRTAEDRPGASARTGIAPLRVRVPAVPAPGGTPRVLGRSGPKAGLPPQERGAAAGSPTTGARLPGRPSLRAPVPYAPAAPAPPVRSDRPRTRGATRACGRSPHGRTAVPEGR